MSSFFLGQSVSVVVMPADANYIATAPDQSGMVMRVTSAVPLIAQRDVQLELSVPGLPNGEVGHPFFLVHNVTTGGQAIQIIGASGTGVVIPTGGKAIVYTDGTNWY